MSFIIIEKAGNSLRQLAKGRNTVIIRPEDGWPCFGVVAAQELGKIHEFVIALQHVFTPTFVRYVVLRDHPDFRTQRKRSYGNVPSAEILC